MKKSGEPSEKKAYGDVFEDGTIYIGSTKKAMDKKSFLKRINQNILERRKSSKTVCRLNLRINKYKEKMGCAHCGYNKHHGALCFDHLDKSKKRRSVSSLLFNYKRTKNNLPQLRRFIFDEIRKCQILCANCHYVKTFENKDFHHISPLYRNIKDYYKRNPHKKNSHIYLE